MEMKKLFSLIAVLLVVQGCLQIDSRNPTPTPQVIYVNASPQVIVTVQPTVIPTVTEKIVYSTPSLVPFIERKGGLEDLGERVEYLQFDISKPANADYHHNPYLIYNSIGKSYFPALKEGTIYWQNIPFYILPDYDSSGKWNVITTVSEDFFSASFQVGQQRTTEVYALVSGWFRKGDRRILGELRLNYEDGEVQAEKLISNENAWNYEPDADNPIPAGKIAWRASSSDPSQILTVMPIKLTRPLIPLGGITVKRLTTGENGFSVFSITGVHRFHTKRLVQTQTEFQEVKYGRERITTLPAGVMINYETSDEGKRVYRQSGTFTSPIFDGETDLVQWKLVDWDADTPAGTELKFLGKVGNVPKVDGTWSEWFEMAKDSPLPQHARFLQWRAEFSTTNSAFTPILREARMTYENPI